MVKLWHVQARPDFRITSSYPAQHQHGLGFSPACPNMLDQILGFLSLNSRPTQILSWEFQIQVRSKFKSPMSKPWPKVRWILIGLKLAHPMIIPDYKTVESYTRIHLHNRNPKGTLVTPTDLIQLQPGDVAHCFLGSICYVRAECSWASQGVPKLVQAWPVYSSVQILSRRAENQG